MKIKHTNINATNFEYLSVGTVFKDSNANLYMKIANITTYYDGTINAIALDNGKGTCFANCDTVVVVDGEFVVNE